MGADETEADDTTAREEQRRARHHAEGQV